MRRGRALPVCLFLFHEESGNCKFAIRATYRNVEKDYHFHDGNEVHGEHIENPSMMGRQLHTSPSKLSKTPGEFDRKFARKLDGTNFLRAEEGTGGVQKNKIEAKSKGSTLWTDP
jgi:hypothetical protein